MGCTEVALLVSAWIEIVDYPEALPAVIVALLVSAWIEIIAFLSLNSPCCSRTPRECVD